MKVITSLTIIVGSLAAASASAESWFPQGAYVQSVQIAGSGCGAQDIGWDQWNNTIKLWTPSYSIEANESTGFQRGFCQAIVDMKKPQGWTYRVKSTEITGWAHIAGNVQAAVDASHYIQASSATSSQHKELSSYYRGHYQLKTQQPGEWAPCGQDRALNVKTSIQLRVPRQSWGWAYLKVNPDTKIELDWKRCQ
jgi:hypothetical protein